MKAVRETVIHKYLFVNRSELYRHHHHHHHHRHRVQLTGIIARGDSTGKSFIFIYLVCVVTLLYTNLSLSSLRQENAFPLAQYFKLGLQPEIVIPEQN